MSTSKSTPLVNQRGAKRLSLRQFVAYGGGDTANNLAFSLALTFLPLYYTDVALISPATVGTIFLMMRFIDAFTDVIIGSIVDRTSTRWGKFRPWIAFACIPLVIMAIACFAIPGQFYGTTWAVVWAAVSYFLMGSVFFTMVNVPYGSLAAAMTDNGEERAKLAIFRSVGAAIMQVLVAVAISPSVQKYQGDPEGLQSAMIRTIAVLGVLAIALYFFLVVSARENVERKVAKVSLGQSIEILKKNRALQALGLNSVVFLVALFTGIGVLAYWSRDVLGDARLMGAFAVILYGAVILLAPFLPHLIRQFGKPRLFQAACFFGLVGGIIVYFSDADSIPLAFAGVVFIGVASGLGNSLMWNLEADTIEYGEWKTGIRNEGTTYAIFSFMRKLGQAIGGAMGVWVIGWFGYNGELETQSQSALDGISTAFGLIPAAFYFIALILMQFYPMSDEQHAEILEELRVRSERDDVERDTELPTAGLNHNPADQV